MLVRSGTKNSWRKYAQNLIVASLLLSSQAFATNEQSSCAPYQSEVRELDQDSYIFFEAELETEVLKDGEYVWECTFGKGVQIDISLMANPQTPLIDTFNKLDQFKTSLARLGAQDGMNCFFLHEDVSMTKTETPQVYKFSERGTVRCHSVGDLERLKRLDLNQLFERALQGTGMHFELIGRPAPSGTTIHN